MVLDSRDLTVYYGISGDLVMHVYEGDLEYSENTRTFKTVRKVLEWMALDEDGSCFYCYDEWVGKVCKF